MFMSFIYSYQRYVCAIVGYAVLVGNSNGSHCHKFHTETFHCNDQIPAGVYRTTLNLCNLNRKFYICICCLSKQLARELLVAFHATFHALQIVDSVEKIHHTFYK